MTIFLTGCLAFTIMRLIERGIRFLYGFFLRLRSEQKTIVTERSWKKLSANVSPELHGMIKTHAQLMGLTITDYILIAINEKLQRENRG